MKTGTKTKWFTAYKDGKRNLPFLKSKGGQSGVYFIKDNNGTIIYIGYASENLYRTVFRHFTTWNDKQAERFVYPHSYKVRIVFTTQKRAQLLEKYLIIKKNPRDNKLKYEDYLTPKEEAQCLNTWQNLEEEAPF